MGDGLPGVDGEADGEADGDPLADSAGLPEGLAPGLRLGTGIGVGSGNSTDGTFNAARTNIKRKMMTTSSTQGRARWSRFGGRAPRYPGVPGRTSLIGRGRVAGAQRR